MQIQRRDALSQWEMHSYVISLILKIRMLEELIYLAQRYQQRPDLYIKERIAKVMTVYYNTKIDTDDLKLKHYRIKNAVEDKNQIQDPAVEMIDTNIFKSLNVETDKIYQ